MRDLWKHFKVDDYSIRIDECGIQQFKPREYYSYQVYQNFVLHYIAKGSGTYMVNNHAYQLTAGQGFIIRQNENVTYYADKNDPWLNYWVGFSGRNFHEFMDFSSLSNVDVMHFKSESQIVNLILEICHYTHSHLDSEMNLFWYNSKINKLLYYITLEFPTDKSSNLSEQNYAKVAHDYIQVNYHKAVSIQDVADFIGISRSYLYKLFLELYGVSPQAFLIQTRMNKAVDLLLHSNHPINIIAQEVGYNDQLHFSKAFKSNFGISPSFFKKTKSIQSFL